MNFQQFQQIYSDVHDDSSTIIFFQNANFIHKTRICDGEHEIYEIMQKRQRC